MAYAFSSIKKKNLYQSDYIAERKAKLVRSRMLYNNFRTSITNNTELSSGLYNKMYMGDACTLIEGNPCTSQESCVTNCAAPVPINYEITVLFYATNTIDPNGILFGNTRCGFNNFIKFAVGKKTTFTFTPTPTPTPTPPPPTPTPTPPPPPVSNTILLSDIAVFDGTKWFIYNDFTINNNKTLTIPNNTILYSDTTIDPPPTIINYGTIINNGTFEIYALYNYGTLTNNNIVICNGGVIFNNNGGIINNNNGGNINLGGGEFYNYLGGEVNNHLGATIYNYGGNYFTNNATFNNSGRFENGNSICGFGRLRGTNPVIPTGNSCPP